MSRDKQIEEFAKDLALNAIWDEDEIPTLNCYETAAFLADRGYRKVTEIFEGVEKLFRQRFSDEVEGEYRINVKDYYDLKKKYESEGEV